MVIIGIAGGTGSGKTTVVSRIASAFAPGEVAVLPQDNYYRDLSSLTPEQRSLTNFDEPAAIEWDLLVNQLKALRSGQTIEMPTYSYLTCTRQDATVTVEPREVVIVEGILVLTCEPLRRLMDIRCYVDADADDRLIRVIERDCIERGRTPQMVIERYERTLKPMHLQYIEPTKRYADIIIPQGGNNTVAVKLLTDYVEGCLRRSK